MSIATGNFVEIVFCWSEWIRIQKVLESTCGDLSPRQVETSNGCEAQVEVALSHWACIKSVLDTQSVKYQYIDRSVSDARWVGDPGKCNPC